MICLNSLELIQRDKYTINKYGDVEQTQKLFNGDTKLFYIPINSVYTIDTYNQALLYAKQHNLNVMPHHIPQSILSQIKAKYHILEHQYIQIRTYTHDNPITEHNPTLNPNTIQLLKQHQSSIKSDLKYKLAFNNLKELIRVAPHLYSYIDKDKLTVYQSIHNTAIIYYTQNPSAVIQLAQTHKTVIVSSGYKGIDTPDFIVTQDTELNTQPLYYLYPKTIKGFIKPALECNLKSVSLQDIHNCLMNKEYQNHTYSPGITALINKYFINYNRVMAQSDNILWECLTERNILSSIDPQNFPLSYFKKKAVSQNEILNLVNSPTTQFKTMTTFGFTPEYQLPLNGKEGKNWRKTLNRFTKLQQDNLIKVEYITDFDKIKEFCETGYQEFYKTWLRLKKKYAKSESQIKAANDITDSITISRFIVCGLPKEVISEPLLISITDTLTNKVLGFSITHLGQHSTINLCQGQTLNQETYPDMQKFIHILEIQYWQEKHPTFSIWRSSTLYKAIVEYSVNKLGSDLIILNRNSK